MLLLSSLFVLGFELELNGYFRTRPKLLSNLTIVELQGVDTLIGYIDSRSMTNFSLGTDNLKLKGRIDLLDNVVWGFNAKGAADSALAETVSLNDIVGKDIPPLKVKRLYLEARTSIGLFMLGFVPSHWGLGMSVNSGDRIYDDFGDTFARFLFATKPFGEESKIITALFFDKAVEGTVLQQGAGDLLDADTDDIGFAVLYEDEAYKGGAYSTMRSQWATNSRAFFISLYSELTPRKFYFGTEIAGLFGSFTPYRDQTVSINSLGAVGRVGYNFSRFFPVLEVAYASPPSADNEFDLDTNRRGTKINAFTFDPNYRPALLLFQFVGGKKFPQPSQKGYTDVLESRRVWNAFYSKLSFTVKTERVFVIPSLLIAWDSQKWKFLGFEPDFEIRNYLLKEKGNDTQHNLFLSLRLGYLFVGERLKELERPGEQFTKKSNVFGIVGLVAYEF
jgi:hypothetical protein